MAAAIAALAMAGVITTAHATFPGENGVIVFENPDMAAIGRAPADGGPAAYLGFGHSPAASPNGRKIAYAFNGKIRVMNIDGSNDAQVTAGTMDGHPAWTVNGRLVFIRNGIQVWQMNADGSNQTQIETLTGETVISFTAYPAEYPTDPKLLFALGLDYGPVSFYEIQTRQIPRGEILGTGNYPSFGPEGKSAIYTSTAWGARETNLDETNDHAVPAQASTGQNVISPDGKLVAAGVGSASRRLLQTRPRAGGDSVDTWPEPVKLLDWSRLPMNCYETTTQSGGGPLAGNVDAYITQCAVVVMPDLGQKGGGVVMQAIIVGVDGRLYFGTAKKNSSGVPVWGPFNPAPGLNGSAYGIKAKKIAIAGGKDGSSQIVIIGADDDLVYHTLRQANGAWQSTGFQPLTGPGSPVFKARDVAIAINDSEADWQGNAQVIANGFELGDVYHRVRWSNSSWSDFALVPGAGGLKTNALAITAGEDGNSYVVATATLADGSSRVMQQVRYASSNWNSSFATVALAPGVLLSASSDVALTLTTAGNAQLLYTDAAGGTWLQERRNPMIIWTQPADNVYLATKSRTVSISAQPNGVGPSEVMLVRPLAQ